MTMLLKGEDEFVAELRRLHEEADPEQARKDTMALPLIDDSVDTLAIGLRGLKRRTPKPELKPEEREEADAEA